jgi:hypothetical protein
LRAHRRIHMVLRELCIIKYLPSPFRRIDGTAQNIPLITIKEPTHRRFLSQYFLCSQLISSRGRFSFLRAIPLANCLFKLQSCDALVKFHRSSSSKSKSAPFIIDMKAIALHPSLSLSISQMEKLQDQFIACCARSAAAKGVRSGNGTRVKSH